MHYCTLESVPRQPCSNQLNSFRHRPCSRYASTHPSASPRQPPLLASLLTSLTRKSHLDGMTWCLPLVRVPSAVETGVSVFWMLSVRQVGGAAPTRLGERAELRAGGAGPPVWARVMGSSSPQGWGGVRGSKAAVGGARRGMRWDETMGSARAHPSLALILEAWRRRST
ncbi:uncharacterized protein BKA78DRAFT_321421 [Phyllosticta capitalensis]|uniref:uncharacterized protein n=1 Tax=Phyllosticta capitalensis TaxID=121624 RepID=UPI00312D221D